MAVKILGAVCIIAACTAMGFRQSFKLNLRYKELQELKKILCLLAGEIRFGGGTLEETFRTVAARSGSPFEDFFCFLSEEMKERTGVRLSELWDRAVRERLSASHLTEEDLDIRLRMGYDLGCLDRETGLSTLTLASEQLEDARRDLYGELPKKMRLYNCLGILAGVFITILLI